MLDSWRTELLAYFDTGGLSNGPTEAINAAHQEDQASRTRIPQLRQLPTPPPASLRSRLANSTTSTNQRPITTLGRVEPLYRRVGSRRICDVPTRRRWIACSGGAVRRSRIRLFAVVRTRNLERCRCNSPTTSSGRATVSRRPRGHRLPSFAVVTWPSHCRLVSTSHVSPLCESTHTTALPEFSTALPMTPNIYYQRQPCLTNNSQAFTQCGTHATNIGSRKVAVCGDIEKCIVGCYWLLLEMVE